MPLEAPRQTSLETDELVLAGLGKVRLAAWAFVALLVVPVCVAAALFALCLGKSFNGPEACAGASPILWALGIASVAAIPTSLFAIAGLRQCRGLTLTGWDVLARFVCILGLLFAGFGFLLLISLALR